MTTNIYIGNWRVDLYKDENITVNASVLDINDIKKNTTPFTMSFTVPASKRNNILFKHWYNANIDNTFDARTKVDGEIFISGISFKIGKFRLSKVNVKKNKPTSYTINFFGNLVSLVDIVKKDELKDLDLSAYDHTFNSLNVKTGLQSNLFSGAIIYTLFAKKQYYYNSNPDNTQTPTLANIAYDGGANTGVIWNDLRPSIQLIKIIEAIETDYNITFTRDFFGLAEFTGLYMWMNNSSTEEIQTNQIIDWDGGDATYMNLGTDIATYPIENSTGVPNLYFDLELTVTPSLGFENVEYTILYYRDDEVLAEIDSTGTSVEDFQVIKLDPEFGSFTTDVYFEIRTSEPFSYSASLGQIGWVRVLPTSTPTIFFTGTTTASVNSITTDITITNDIPKIKIIDFLKGLFDMFKLVVVPQDNGDIYVNTLNAYYAEGNSYDITRYVDFESVDIQRGNILNTIDYKFQEPTTILSTQFEANTGQAYGDELTILYTDDTQDELLDGESLEIELPFEQIVYDRLVDQRDNINTFAMYAPIIDENIEAVNPKAHIFYIQPKSQISKPLGFINDAGVKEAISFSMNVAFHSDSTVNPNFSTIFGAEFNEWNGSLIDKTLFKNHWEEYIQAIFNIKKREFSYKSVLPLRIISKLELNDVLYIKGNYYRLNNYSHNLTTDETTLNLVNSFDNTVNPFNATPINIYEQYEATNRTVYITNSEGSTSLKVDLGHGTSWVTVSTLTTNANTFFLAIDENTGEDARDMLITFTQPITGTEQNVYIQQQPEKYVPSLNFSDSRNSWQLSLLTLRT